jgi:small ligand-binding sensory domain FIST
VEPEFALLFSCLGRGPYFYNGFDQDLALIKTLFPNLPIIGFYGNGEIAPINGINELLQYSAVLGLFTESNVAYL